MFSSTLRRPAAACRQLALAFVLLLWAVPAWTEWATLGNMPAPRRDRDTLVFRNAQGAVAITAVSPDVIRVRFRPGPSLGRDHSYAVVGRPADPPAATFAVTADRSTISTPTLTITVRHRPFGVAIADASGETIDEDDPVMGTAFSGRTTRVHKRLRDEDQVYGFGEKTGRLNKRGRMMGGYFYTRWNTDRLFELRVRWDGPARTVTLQTAPGGARAPLGAYPANELEKRAAGWTITGEGFVLVKMADRWDGTTITIER